MGTIREKHRSRGKRKRTKSWKFWVLFVATPIIVVLCSSIAFYGLHTNKKSSIKRTQGLQQGLIYAKLKRYSEAIEEFKKELEKNPDSTNAYYHLGSSYLKLKEYDNAETAIKNALKLKPNFSEARFQLAIIVMARADGLRKLGESESVVLEKLLEAEDICREIIEKDQNFLKSYALLGQIHFSQGLLDDAIIDYKHLLNVDNTFVNGHIALARLYIKKGKLDLAEKECNLVLSEFEPDNIQSLFLLSTIYEKTRKYDEAVVLLKQILEKNPGNKSVHIQLGLLYLKLSKYDEAFAESEYAFNNQSATQPAAVYFIQGSVWLQRRDYEKAVSVLKEATLRLPNMVETHYFLAHAEVGLGRLQEAINEFKVAINVAPSYIPAKLSLARLLSRVGGWQREIVRLCKDILDIKPDHIEALQMLGLEYVKKRDFENAELEFRKIIELSPSAGKINMAYLSLASGQLGRSIRLCEEIINTNPDETRAYNILGFALIRQGNFERGIEQYKKVIEINPKSVSTFINIAKAYVIIEKKDEAIKALKNAISLDPTNLPSKTLLSGIYRKEGNIDEAAKLLEQVVEINPDNVDGYALAGIYLLRGKIDASINLCNKAIKLFPDDTTLYTNLAVSYQQKEHYVASIKYSEKSVGLKPEDPSLKVILINNYIANGEFSTANEQIGTISTFTSDQAKAYHELLDLCQLDSKKGKQIALALNRSIFARRVGLLELAISECKKAVEIFPENVVAKIILANNYLTMNRNEDAIAIYSEIIKDKPEIASSYYDLGKAYLKADKEDDAISTYQNMIGVDSKSIAGRLALAALLVKQGDADKAAKMIEDVIELDSNNLIAHDLLGKVSLSERDYNKAETAFSKMIELSRDSFEGHFNMARIKYTQGDFDSCIEHCKIALETKPLDVRVLNILGMAFLRKGWIGDAALKFNKIININSDFIPAYLNLAEININSKKPIVAALLYKAALKIDSDAVKARLGLGNSYALMGKYSDAVTEFESVIKKYPKNVNAHISLAKTYLVSGDSIKAQEAITSALVIEPENPIARYVLAKIYVKKEEIRHAILQLKRVLPGNQEILSLYELGVLYVDVEDYDNAILTYKQGVENFPKNYILWCNLAAAYQMNKDFKSSKDAYDKAIEIEPKNIIPNLYLVYTYLANGENENAWRHLEDKTNIRDDQKDMYFDLLELCSQNKEVAEKVSYHLLRILTYTNYKWFNRILKECEEVFKIIPSNTVACNVQLDILILTKEVDKAIKVCDKIIEIDPENPTTYNKLAGIYQRKGEIDEALAQYRNAIGVDSNNVVAHMGMGILLEGKNLLDETVKAYEKVIKLAPDSKVAYNNLAWLYASKMKEKMNEALELAKKAKKLDSNNPAVNDTLGWIYYMHGNYDKAVSLLRVAIRSATWNPTIRYHLGMAYYKKGFQREAITEMQRALKISNTFPEAEEAKKIIEEIIVKRIKDTEK